ncbi:hypothetical protein CERSUDRAFT_75689 [Gelatoporia subvermispora B]|uniref:Uncharacterized protein n=1 Tax=Ceriporiopsis subvermispora (strain B) TaxID=914234 RepID=M2R7U2_CERS8|nr:hypothetical protein CERSUDRAFT_75689 [Gelatoporia subvermispora B]
MQNSSIVDSRQLLSMQHPEETENDVSRRVITRPDARPNLLDRSQAPAFDADALGPSRQLYPQRPQETENDALQRVITRPDVRPSLLDRSQAPTIDADASGPPRQFYLQHPPPGPLAERHAAMAMNPPVIHHRVSPSRLPVELPQIETLAEDDPYDVEMPGDAELQAFDTIDNQHRQGSRHSSISAATHHSDMSMSEWEGSSGDNRRLTLGYVADMSLNGADMSLNDDLSFVDVSSDIGHIGHANPQAPAMQNLPELSHTSILADAIERPVANRLQEPPAEGLRTSAHSPAIPPVDTAPVSSAPPSLPSHTPFQPLVPRDVSTQGTVDSGRDNTIPLRQLSPMPGDGRDSGRRMHLSPADLPLRQLSPMEGGSHTGSYAALVPSYDPSRLPPHLAASGHTTAVGIGIHRGNLMVPLSSLAMGGMRQPAPPVAHSGVSLSTMPSGSGRQLTPQPTAVTVEPPSSSERAPLRYEFPCPVQGALHTRTPAEVQAIRDSMSAEEKAQMMADLPPSSPGRWPAHLLSQNASPAMPGSNLATPEPGGANTPQVEVLVADLEGNVLLDMSVDELAGIAASDANVDDADADADDATTSRPGDTKEKEAARRVAGELRRRLLVEVLAIDETINAIAKKNDVSSETVLRIWGGTHRHPRHKVSLWAQYEVHYSYNEAEENARLAPDIVANTSRRDLVPLCFEAFKQHYRDEETMKDILSTAYDIHLLLTGKGRTVGSRKRAFGDWTNDTKLRLLTGHKRHGFESVVVAVGGGTFQDDPLTEVWESPGAEGRVLGDNWKALILGHVRAQAMMFNSEQARQTMTLAPLPDFLGGPLAGPSGSSSHVAGGSATSTKQSGSVPGTDASTLPSLATAAPTLPSHQVAATSKTSGGGSNAASPSLMPAADPEVHGNDSGPDDVLRNLRVRYIHFIYTARGDNATHLTQAPWASLFSLLRAAGLVIINWPEDVPHPQLEDGKGIAILRLEERQSLLRAFDHPDFPLQCVRDHELNRNLAAGNKYLAIINAPPAPSSRQRHALRVWYTKVPKRIWKDRGGPARLPAVAAPSDTSDIPQPIRRRRPRPVVESEDDKSGRPSTDAEQDELEDEVPEPDRKRLRMDPPATAVQASTSAIATGNPPQQVQASTSMTANPAQRAQGSSSTTTTAADQYLEQYRDRAPPAKFSKDQLTPSDESTGFGSEIRFVSRRPAPGGQKAKVMKDSPDFEVVSNANPLKPSTRVTKKGASVKAAGPSAPRQPSKKPAAAKPKTPLMPLFMDESPSPSRRMTRATAHEAANQSPSRCASVVEEAQDQTERCRRFQGFEDDPVPSGDSGRGPVRWLSRQKNPKGKLSTAGKIIQQPPDQFVTLAVHAPLPRVSHHPESSMERTSAMMPAPIPAPTASAPTASTHAPAWAMDLSGPAPAPVAMIPTPVPAPTMPIAAPTVPASMPVISAPAPMIPVPAPTMPMPAPIMHVPAPAPMMPAQTMQGGIAAAPAGQPGLILPPELLGAFMQFMQQHLGQAQGQGHGPGGAA